MNAAKAALKVVQPRVFERSAVREALVVTVSVLPVPLDQPAQVAAVVPASLLPFATLYKDGGCRT